jgi:pimeloyl-ACP methyl ester carboxylesterase
MRETLRSIEVPTLVLLGQRDYVCRNSARLLAEKIPGACIERIPNAGHMSPLEEPARFNASLIDFMRR